MKPFILIIDDDEKLNQLLETYLPGFGFRIDSAVTPAEGLHRLASKKPDLIVLDVMLPEMDGFSVLKLIRRDSQIPVIMLTARGEVMDRILGLELGADDYLPKPFEPRELVARIQTVLRRTAYGPQTDSKTYGDLEINFTKQAVFLNGQELSLTTNEYEILALLVRKAGQTLSRDQIMEELKGLEWDAFNRSIDITVSRIRQKLNDDPKTPRYIRTVWGTGYKFIPDKM